MDNELDSTKLLIWRVLIHTYLIILSSRCMGSYGHLKTVGGQPSWDWYVVTVPRAGEALLINWLLGNDMPACRLMFPQLLDISLSNYADGWWTISSTKLLICRVLDHTYLVIVSCRDIGSYNHLQSVGCQTSWDDNMVTVPRGREAFLIAFGKWHAGVQAHVSSTDRCLLL